MLLVPVALQTECRPFIYLFAEAVLETFTAAHAIDVADRGMSAKVASTCAAARGLATSIHAAGKLSLNAAYEALRKSRAEPKPLDQRDASFWTGDDGEDAEDDDSGVQRNLFAQDVAPVPSQAPTAMCPTGAWGQRMADLYGDTAGSGSHARLTAAEVRTCVAVPNPKPPTPVALS